LLPRERDDVLRKRGEALRDFAPAVDLFGREPDVLAADLRAPAARPEPELEALARAVLDFFLPPLLARELLAVEPDDLAREPVEREVDERPPAEPRELPAREEADPPELALLEASSVVHLPDITRCAASATASAISEPSLVALAMTLLAA
jgi:hypothetical protein